MPVHQSFTGYGAHHQGLSLTGNGFLRQDGIDVEKAYGHVLVVDLDLHLDLRTRPYCGVGGRCWNVDPRGESL